MTIIAIAKSENDMEAVRIEYNPKSETERDEVTRRLLDFWRHETDVFWKGIEEARLS